MSQLWRWLDAFAPRSVPQRELQQGAVSVDASRLHGDEIDLYLARARHAFPSGRTHRTTQQAALNLQAPPVVSSARHGVVVGHGASGFISTGGGRDYVPPDKAVAAWNRDDWWHHLEAVAPHIDQVVLLGCRVGAGAVGASLLHEVACAINGEAVAPNGNVLLDALGRIWLSAGSGWQSATCGSDPKPMPTIDTNTAKNSLTWHGAATEEALPLLEAVQFIEYRPELQLPLAEYRGEAQHLEGGQARALLESLDARAVLLPRFAELLSIRFGVLTISHVAAGRVREDHYEVLSGGSLRPLKRKRRRVLFEPRSPVFFEQLTGLR